MAVPYSPQGRTDTAVVGRRDLLAVACARHNRLMRGGS